MTPIFSPAAIAEAVARELAGAVPPWHRHAVALVATTSGEVKGVLSTKVNDRWQVDAIFSAKRTAIAGAVAVTASW